MRRILTNFENFSQPVEPVGKLAEPVGKPAELVGKPDQLVH